MQLQSFIQYGKLFQKCNTLSTKKSNWLIDLVFEIFQDSKFIFKKYLPWLKIPLIILKVSLRSLLILLSSKETHPNFSIFPCNSNLLLFLLVLSLFFASSQSQYHTPISMSRHWSPGLIYNTNKLKSLNISRNYFIELY